jgi:hypothetical protein
MKLSTALTKSLETLEVVILKWYIKSNDFFTKGVLLVAYKPTNQYTVQIRTPIDLSKAKSTKNDYTKFLINRHILFPRLFTYELDINFLNTVSKARIIDLYIHTVWCITTSSIISTKKLKNILKEYNL